MNELALFAGIGGGILASTILGHRIVCAVENNPYCQSVLLQRQNDGFFFPFPIWDDVRTFDGKKWNGIVDLVSGGFPCQNISDSGKGEGIYGEHSRLWFEMLRIIHEAKPRYAFIENSPRLVSRGLDIVLKGLAQTGYDAEWTVLGADDCGAPHERKRIWILARKQEISNASLQRCDPFVRVSKRLETKIALPSGNCQKISNTKNMRIVRRKWKHENATKIITEQRNNRSGTPRYDQWQWWNTEPELGRVAHGIANRTHRLRGIGNAQVPIVAAMAFKILLQRFSEVN
jgi:DNA (cytosine-5)-methyltransferase 1